MIPHEGDIVCYKGNTYSQILAEREHVYDWEPVPLGEGTLGIVTKIVYDDEEELKLDIRFGFQHMGLREVLPMHMEAYPVCEHFDGRFYPFEIDVIEHEV